MNDYKSVCDKCFKKTWYETEQQCHCQSIEGVRCIGILRIINNSELDDRFTQYYDTGERVEVEWLDGFEDYTGYGCRTEGKKGRFYVGKSTGWTPIYLTILRRNSFGGGGICSSGVKSIRGLGIYK